MKISLFNTMRRWRWEWLYIILALVVFGCSGYGCLRHTFRSEITAEESKTRFGNLISSIEEILKSYGADFHEVDTLHDIRYMRRISCEFSGGIMDIFLENDSGAEKYTIEMKMLPGQTLEQSLPDDTTIFMACETFSLLSQNDFTYEDLEKTLTYLIDDARRKFATVAPRSEPGFIYSEDMYNSVFLKIHQENQNSYTTYIKFTIYKFQ